MAKIIFLFLSLPSFLMATIMNKIVSVCSEKHYILAYVQSLNDVSTDHTLHIVHVLLFFFSFFSLNNTSRRSFLIGTYRFIFLSHRIIIYRSLFKPLATSKIWFLSLDTQYITCSSRLVSETVEFTE